MSSCGISRIAKIQRIKWEELSKENIKREFVNELQQRFEALPQDTPDVEKDWELFKLGLMASAIRCCGKKYIGPAPDGRLRIHGGRMKFEISLGRKSLLLIIG